MKWLTKVIGSLMDRIAPVREDFDPMRTPHKRIAAPKPAPVHVTRSDLYIGKHGGTHTLLIRLSDGETHVYRWRQGQGAEVRTMVANTVYAKTTTLNWDCAARINNEVRTAEKIGTNL